MLLLRRWPRFFLFSFLLLPGIFVSGRTYHIPVPTTSPFTALIHAATLRSRTRRQSQTEIEECPSPVDCPAHVLTNGGVNASCSGASRGYCGQEACDAGFELSEAGTPAHYRMASGSWCVDVGLVFLSGVGPDCFARCHGPK